MGILKAGENCESKPPTVYIVNFPRGLRTHRYSCVALRALMKSQPSKLSQPSKHYFPRGLHTPRYSCVALRALMKSQPSKPSQPSKLSKPSKPS